MAMFLYQYQQLKCKLYCVELLEKLVLLLKGSKSQLFNVCNDTLTVKEMVQKVQEAV